MRVARTTVVSESSNEPPGRGVSMKYNVKYTVYSIKAPARSSGAQGKGVSITYKRIKYTRIKAPERSNAAPGRGVSMRYKVPASPLAQASLSQASSASTYAAHAPVLQKRRECIRAEKRREYIRAEKRRECMRVEHT